MAEPTKITPVADRVVVRCDPVPEFSAAGLSLGPRPQTPDRGVVVAMGAGRHLAGLPGVRYCCDASVGDRVLFPPHAGKDLRVGANLYRVLRSGDILAVLEEGDGDDGDKGEG